MAWRELAAKLAALERRVGRHDRQIKTVFEAIRELMSPPAEPPRRIGFSVRERRPRYLRSAGRP